MSKEYNYMSTEDQREHDKNEAQLRESSAVSQAQYQFAQQQRRIDEMHHQQAQSIEWLQIPEEERDQKISRAVEREALKDFIKQGISSLQKYIYQSHSIMGRVEFTINLFGKHEFRLGARPGNVDKAKELLKILLQAESAISNWQSPQLAQITKAISLFAPEEKSKGKYKHIFNQLLKESAPYTGHFKKEKAIVEVRHSLDRILPKDLVQAIENFIREYLDEDTFHGRDVSDYRSQFNKS